MTIEISIIVPVYNLEDYLPKCIDSVLMQTFTNFELILVNDGSTDNSGEICNEYAKNDHRIKVVHKANGGVASSRNTGLEVAKGKYIGFVDNDDYINQYMFEMLYNNAIIHSADIVVCGYMDVDEGQYENTKVLHSNYQIKHFNNIEALNELYTINNVTFLVPWNKLYKKSLFEDIKYEVGILCDDETVAHKIFYESKKITYINVALYYYVKRMGSITNSRFNIKKFEGVYVLKERERYFRERRELDLHQKALKSYVGIFFYCYYRARAELSNIDNELKALKRTFDKSMFYLLRCRGISWKRKSLYMIFSISPSLYLLIEDFREKNSRTIEQEN